MLGSKDADTALESTMRCSRTYPAAPVMMAFFPAKRPLPVVLAISKVVFPSCDCGYNEGGKAN